MTNALYGKAREGFANKTIDWNTDTIKVTLVDAADYTVAIDTDQYMNTNTVPAASKVATATIANCTNTLGVCDGDDVVFSDVSGDVSEALVIWLDGGGGGILTDGTSDLLIAYIDSATGLPVTPNGTDISVTWDSGANKIFKL